MKKYELTDETIEIDGHILHRIRALRNFTNIKAGDLGGWVETENNLSQKGTSWIFDEAKVYEDAKVYGFARIFDHAQIYGSARIYNSARVRGSRKISGNRHVRNWDVLA